MRNAERIIAVIPAHGSSIGLPNKNFLPIGETPMIGWAITKALSIHEIDTVVVSTDSDRLRVVTREYEAEVQFLRSKHLAKNDSP